MKIDAFVVVKMIPGAQGSTKPVQEIIFLSREQADSYVESMSGGKYFTIPSTLQISLEELQALLEQARK